jgi:hypothetical protein
MQSDIQWHNHHAGLAEEIRADVFEHREEELIQFSASSGGNDGGYEDDNAYDGKTQMDDSVSGDSQSQSRPRRKAQRSSLAASSVQNSKKGKKAAVLSRGGEGSAKSSLLSSGMHVRGRERDHLKRHLTIFILQFIT